MGAKRSCSIMQYMQTKLLRTLHGATSLFDFEWSYCLPKIQNNSDKLLCCRPNVHVSFKRIKFRETKTISLQVRLFCCSLLGLF